MSEKRKKRQFKVEKTANGTEYIAVDHAFEDREVYLPKEVFDRQLAFYEKVAKELSQHGCVLQGYGGVLTIVHPRVAIEEGVYHQMQKAAGRDNTMYPSVLELHLGETE